MDQIINTYIDKVDKIEEYVDSIVDSLIGFNIHVEVGLKFFGDIPKPQLSERDQNKLKEIFKDVKGIKQSADFINSENIDLAKRIYQEIEENTLKALDNDVNHYRRKLYAQKCEKAFYTLKDVLLKLELAFDDLHSKYARIYEPVKGSLNVMLSQIGQDWPLSQMMPTIYFYVERHIDHTIITLHDISFWLATSIKSNFQVFDKPSLDGVSKNADSANPISQNAEKKIKLTWTGAKNTLYDIIRQLKNNHNTKGDSLISEGYDHIAHFLKEHINGFENVSLSTIRGQLTKEPDIKKENNRVIIDLKGSDFDQI